MRFPLLFPSWKEKKKSTRKDGALDERYPQNTNPAAQAKVSRNTVQDSTILPIFLHSTYSEGPIVLRLKCNQVQTWDLPPPLVDNPLVFIVFI